ncbi:MAG: butyrate kinase [Clostridiales bacterium]|nr:butyrate kinase [Clostridiales bacterium]
MSERILAINPGSTSTKIAYYEGEEQIFLENIAHPRAELEEFETILSQLDYRLKTVLDALEKHGVDPAKLDIVVGRGGMFPPVKAGGYVVNEAMRRMIYTANIPQHASNLGGLIAHDIARLAGVKGYIYDATSVDEFPPIAKITGIPEVERQSFCHVLNSKAVARMYAESIGKEYEDLNLVVAHLGGGISMSTHKGGKMVDSQSDDAGSFAPERAGSIPSVYVIDLCYSGEYNRAQMKKKIRGMGGLRAHLGTTDCREVERRIREGDEHAKLVYDAMIYQIAKGITLSFPALEGKIDAILLTGGVSYSDYVCEGVKKYVGAFAPVVRFPGEYEMEALAAGGRRILEGEPTHEMYEEEKTFVLPKSFLERSYL